MTGRITFDEPEREIPERLDLAFDPATVADAEILKIFADPIAEQIWLAYSWRHLRSQYFAGDCLRLAARIHKRPPADTDALMNLAYGTGRASAGWASPWGASKRFWTALLTYVRRERKIHYRILTPDSWSAW